MKKLELKKKYFAESFVCNYCGSKLRVGFTLDGDGYVCGVCFFELANSCFYLILKTDKNTEALKQSSLFDEAYDVEIKEV